MYHITIQQHGLPTMDIPVTVTKVHDDGACDFLGDSVKGVHSSEPIYDDTGQRVTPMAEKSAEEILREESEAIQLQLIDTQVALATMYETLAAIMMGGGL